MWPFNKFKVVNIEEIKNLERKLDFLKNRVDRIDELWMLYDDYINGRIDPAEIEKIKKNAQENYERNCWDVYEQIVKQIKAINIDKK